MNHSFDEFVTNIVNQIDGTEKEKADVYEELYIHIQLSSEQYVHAGYNLKEAEQLAMNSFWSAYTIGNQMQEAMFPMRKVMLLFLSISSISYSFIVYILHLITEGDAFIAWLIISVITSSTLLLFAVQTFSTFNRKSLLNTTLIIHTFIYFYGSSLASSIHFSIFLSIVAWGIIIISILLIYRTTITDYQFSNIENNNIVKLLHFLNITIGIFIIGITLFFLWGLLAFSEIFELKMLVILIPVSIWIIAYFIQIKLLNNHKIKSASFIAAIPFILVISFGIFWFTNVL